MRVWRRCFLMEQRSSGYGQLVRVGALRRVTARVAFGSIVRIRDRANEPRARIGGDAAFGRAPVGARTNGRAADGPWAVQQTDRSPIEYRSRDRQVACETHLLEADGPDPGPGGLSSINARPCAGGRRLVGRLHMGRARCAARERGHHRAVARGVTASTPRSSDMKSILDPDFEYTPSVETDIRATFERVWRELDTREQAHTSPGDDCNSVWLECNGDLIDSCSVK